MPYSDGSLRPWLLRHIQDRLTRDGPVQIVDVGAGAGLNVDFFRPHVPASQWTAIEIWRPYVDEFQLLRRYNVVITGDAREIPLPSADLYILGDVLEHMTNDEAIELWNRCREVSHFVAATLPIVHYPQGAINGNPHEEHRHHYTVNEFLVDFPGITDSTCGDVVGAFWAEGLFG